jgi:hypothetical protein
MTSSIDWYGLERISLFKINNSKQRADFAAIKNKTDYWFNTQKRQS